MAVKKKRRDFHIGLRCIKTPVNDQKSKQDKNLQNPLRTRAKKQTRCAKIPPARRYPPPPYLYKQQLLVIVVYRSYAQYREPRLLPFKKYLVTKFYFFQLYSTCQVIRRLFLPFFRQKILYIV